MAFNSLVFLSFLALVYLLYFTLPKNFRWIILLASSVGFYMYGEPYYIFLLLATIIIDFFLALQLARTSNPLLKKTIFLCSLGINLSLLFVFKYFNFFAGIFNASVNNFHEGHSIPVLALALPVGISFYTFQEIGYMADVYRNRISPEKNLGKFMLFILFFPQLIAGPIEKASDLLPQLHTKGNASDKFLSGFCQILWGYFKKTVVADNLGLYVDAAYNHHGEVSGATLLIATYAFAFQIYCDFSGYCDIGIGIARTLGFDLSINFDNPYASKNISEFWRRWHITLSHWLKDYLYIPLGGSKEGKFNTYRNLFITMLLAGLWHGASFTFLIWGIFQGFCLILERILGIDKMNYSNVWSKIISMFITFNVLSIGWIYFRSENLLKANEILKKILSGHIFRGIETLKNEIFVTMLTGVIIVVVYESLLRKKMLAKNVTFISNKSNYLLAGWNAFLFFMIILFGVSDTSTFIYFQF
jgi:alginate O-acetyltransferase complex protein AlgI